MKAVISFYVIDLWLFGSAGGRGIAANEPLLARGLQLLFSSASTSLANGGNAGTARRVRRGAALGAAARRMSGNARPTREARPGQSLVDLKQATPATVAGGDKRAPS